VNDNRQHDRLVQRRADADSIHALMPMALVQTRPGPSVRPVMVHGASATTQFMRAATGTADPTQQQQGKGRVPADAGRQKPPRP
jgi:hypothetical protein